jgi:type I restriction enzyme S subunit
MVELVTEHMDIWTAAQTPKTNGGRGHGNNSNRQSIHGMKKLRELILELAVRGKLVPQDPNDEPASVLLGKSAKEKTRLTKEGKIKKQKPLPKIRSEEKPYDLPVGWIWAYLSDVGQIVGGGTPKSTEPSYWAESEIKWLTPADLYGLEKKYVSAGRRDISVKGLESSSAKLLPIGSVLFSSRAPIGYIAIAESELATNQGFKSCVPYLAGMSEYIYLFLKRSAGEIDSQASGTTFKEISGAGMSKVLFALPPLNEQHRIVDKVDELMSLCDRLEHQQADSNETHQVLVETLLAALTQAADQRGFAATWQRIADHFDTLFITESSIDQLKQTILQLAVMGKLVHQDANDEPASVLLGKIAKEKTRLIKEGKIKKQKPLSEIGEEEKPFELPNGWEWVRFSELSQEVSTGPFGTMIHKRDYVDGGIPLINPSHMIDYSIVEDTSVAVSPKKAEELSSYKLSGGDIVLARRGEMGRCALVTERENGWICGTGSFRLKFHIELDRQYILLLFKTDIVRNYLGGESVGTTMTNLNHGILNKLPILLPPTAEQHRIIAKVDELMALCDDLRNRLNRAQTTQIQLADAIVEQAVA